MKYSRVLQEVRAARNPHNGKKIDYATKARLVTGSIDEPGVLAIRHHDTDILLYHPDGAMDVRVNGLCESSTTKQRFWQYGNISVSMRDIPAVNGFAVSPHRQLFLSVGHTAPFVPYVSTGKYIRINPDRTIDMSTVGTHRVNVVLKPTELRREMRKVGMIIRVLLGYIKLREGLPRDTLKYRYVRAEEWLLAQYRKPVEDIDLVTLPFIGVNDDPKQTFKTAANHVRWIIAREQELIGPQEIRLG